MINLILPIITSPKFIIGSVVAVAAALFGYKTASLLKQEEIFTLKSKIVAYEKEKDRLEKENLILRGKSKDVTIEVVTKYVDRVTVVTEKADEIIREIPIYVTKEADKHCTITDGWVFNHDRAAALSSTSPSRVPKAPVKPDEATTGIELSDAAATIAKNYEQCSKVMEQLKSLQEWVTKQEATFNTK